MTEDSLQRGLRAIFSADVKGYSRLMGDNEEHTVKTITSYRKILAELIVKHHGRVVDSPGDNVLAEFSSAVNALKSAVEIQKSLNAKNEALPDSRKMIFRIGINLGDIIKEGDRIYGDGVNIASRIEGLTDPGGVCISRSVYDQVKKKIELGFEYLGEYSVKNISDPVRVYRVLADPEAAGKVIGERSRSMPKHKNWMVLAAGIFFLFCMVGLFIYQKGPEKKAVKFLGEASIAVLPFKNLTGDPAKENLCDGLSEDIINALSKVPKLIVIARHSTFLYKGKSLSVQELGTVLNARYVLEGNVRRADDRLRVSSQLIESETAKNIWAETYDRQINDLFLVQEEITLNIIAAMQVTLTEGLQARMWRKKSSNLDAYLKIIQAVEEFRKFTREGNHLSRELAEASVKLDPEYAGAYRMIGWTHLVDARFGFSVSPDQSIKMAMDMAQKAMVMDDQDPYTYYLLAGIHLRKNEHDLAVANIRKASEMAPNSADILSYKANVLNYSGEPAEALSSIFKAMRLNPQYPNWYDGQVGLSYHLQGDYQKALDNYRKMRERNPNSFLPQAMIVICYTNLNLMAEAKKEAKRLLGLRPDFTKETWNKMQPYRDQTILKEEITALQKAGAI